MRAADFVSALIQVNRADSEEALQRIERGLHIQREPDRREAELLRRVAKRREMLRVG